MSAETDIECIAAKAVKELQSIFQTGKCEDYLCCDPTLMFDTDINLGDQITFTSFQEQGRQLISPSGTAKGIEVVTLLFGLDYEVGVADGVKWLAPLADITWTQGKAKFSATVDIAQGMMMTLLAQGLTVKVRSPAPSPALPGDPDTFAYDSATISVGAAWGTRASRSSVTRSFSPREILAAGVTEFIEIPNFAYALDLFSPTSTTPFNVEFYADNSTSFLIHMEPGASYLPGRQEEGVKIPSSAHFFLIRNTDAGDQTVMSSFRLAF